MNDWLMTLVSALIGGGVATAVFHTMIGHGIERRIDHFFDVSRDRIQNELGKDLEGYKARIRLYEELYPRQIEAFTEIFNLQQESLPSGPRPEIDWEEAVEQASYNISRFSTALGSILRKYGAILPESVVEHLRLAQQNCDHGSYLLGETKGEVSYEVMESTNRYFRELGDATRLLRSKLEVDSVK